MKPHLSFEIITLFTRIQYDIDSSHFLLKKMVLDTSLLNTQHYKVRIKGKVEQSREKSSALPYTLVW